MKVIKHKFFDFSMSIQIENETNHPVIFNYLLLELKRAIYEKISRKMLD